MPITQGTPATPRFEHDLPGEEHIYIGGEFLYGWRVNKDNSKANAPRIQFSAKYNFVRSQPLE